jgi:hypothetical protein
MEVLLRRLRILLSRLEVEQPPFVEYHSGICSESLCLDKSFPVKREPIDACEIQGNRTATYMVVEVGLLMSGAITGAIGLLRHVNMRSEAGYSVLYDTSD